MSVRNACPQCQQPLPEGFIGAACPHCRAALGNKRRRSLSGFSFQTYQPGTQSSRPPLAPLSSRPPREAVEDRWDLPDGGAAPAAPAERRAAPQPAPTGFPVVPSPVAARQNLRSTMAIGVDRAAMMQSDPPTDAPPAAAARVGAPPVDPLRATAQFDPFSWNIDQATPSGAPPPGALDPRSLRRTAQGVAARPAPVALATVGAIPPAAEAPMIEGRTTAARSAFRQTVAGVLPVARDFAPEPAEEPEEEDAFPLVRSTQPPPPVATWPPPSNEPPPPEDYVAAITSRRPPSFALEGDEPLVDESMVRASQLSAYTPLRAPPSRRAPPPVTRSFGWWAIGGALLVLSAAVALRSAPMAVALRAAAGAAALMLLARFGALSMRALLLLLVALPALAQEALSIASLSRAGAAVLTGALVLFPAGAWVSGERLLLRRALLVPGIALTVAATLMPGGVGAPWSYGAVPALIMGAVALGTPARWASTAVTALLAAWAVVCGVNGGASGLPGAATGIAMAALVLVCGRAIALVFDNDGA